MSLSYFRGNYVTHMEELTVPFNVDDKIRAKRETIARLEQEITELQNRPTEPFSHDVISFTKQLSGQNYKYAAVRAAGKWWVSGKRNVDGHYGRTWDSLLLFIGAENWNTIRVYHQESTWVP